MASRSEWSTGAAAAYADRLLCDLAVRGVAPPPADDLHPAVAWARSGAMWLTGPERGPVAMAPAGVTIGARGALAALVAVAGDAAGALQGLDSGGLLGERAARLGLRRRGATSPGTSCRMLRSCDGWIALNLARPDDLQLLPAWLETEPARDAWSFAASRIAQQPTARLLSRGRLLGLPVAAAERARSAPAWLRIGQRGAALRRSPHARPRVLDLSSLWAGPLCTQLLCLAGAEVVKVECERRPDGGRQGEPGFYDLLNGGKRSVALDFRSALDRARLVRLVRWADIVVESARPRALAQLGIHAAQLVGEIPGLCWVSITGYGRREPEGSWVGFGDDTAVAAGLAAATGLPDRPIFCGDAIADPLTGMHAAVAALGSFRSGEARLIDVNLRDVTAHVLGLGPEAPTCQVRATSRESDEWAICLGGDRWPVAAPRSRPVCQQARPLGADTVGVLQALGIRC